MTLGGAIAYFFFQLLIPLMFAISVGSFLWGACLFFMAGDQDGELGDNGKTVMLYGLLALVVTMISYGFLSLIRGGA